MKKFVCDFGCVAVYEEDGAFTAFTKGGKRLYRGKDRTRAVDAAKEYADKVCRADRSKPDRAIALAEPNVGGKLFERKYFPCRSCAWLKNI